MGVRPIADWCVLTVTFSGHVSLIKGLTRDEAYETGKRLSPVWANPDLPPDHREHLIKGYDMNIQPGSGDYRSVEVFRGAGETMNVFAPRPL